MDTAAEVLVIIVSAVLAIFLIVATVATISIIKVTKQVRLVVDRAENVAASMESAADTFKKTATPLAFLRILGNIVEHTAGARRKR